MNEQPHFNLLTQAWIPVETGEGELVDLGIADLLARSGEVRALECELPTQEFAVLRLLLAILRRALGWEAEDHSDLVARWRELWGGDSWPTDVWAYLAEFEDRFWLMGGGAPFYQVPDLTPVNQARGPGSLKGLISDVPAGFPFFTQRRSTSWERLSLAEAAQWLVHVHAFDPAGIRTGVRGDPGVSKGKSYPIGTGWCGAIGGQYAQGATLRETLLLNLVPTEPSSAPGGDIPAWELGSTMPPAGDGREPRGPIDLLTWQSRRVRLFGDDTGITGVIVTNGDRCRAQNRQRLESMTSWRRSKAQEKALGQEPVYMPREHVAGRSIWRGLSALLADPASGGSKPGVLPSGLVSWLADLRAEGALADTDEVTLRVVGYEYGSKGSTVADLVSDGLTVHLAVLGENLRHAAVRAAEEADQAAVAAGGFYSNLYLAAGGDPRAAADHAAQGREQFFAVLDPVFRAWLAGLAVETVDADRADWQRIVVDLARSLGREWLAGAQPDSWIGRTVGGRTISAPLAEVWFGKALRKALTLAYAKEESDDRQG